MTAPFTEEELATRVLRDMGLIGAEETPSAADMAWAIETCSSEIDLLAAKGIGIWNGTGDSVPNEYLTVLSRRIGLALGPSFGLGDIASATSAILQLEKDLRTISSKPHTGAVAEADHF
jgi:hypothetical protein